MTTAEYGLSKAARSFNSRLDKSKLVEAGFTPLPTWQDKKLDIAVRRSWDVWSGIPVHLQVFWQMSAIVVMYWQERPLHRTF